MTKDKIEISGADTLIKAASSELQKLLDQAFNNLKATASLKRDDQPPRLFFPHGIELIYVKISVGLPKEPVVEVEVKIAGEKGIKAVDSNSKIEIDKQMAATSGSEQ